MTRHTPEPWEAMETLGIAQIQTSDGYILARVLCESDEQKANTRLIALAPELLKSLMDFVVSIHLLSNNEEYKSLPEDLSDEIKYALTLIEKTKEKNHDI